MGSGLFLVNSCRHLGIVFPWLLCPDVASSTSCLGCSFVCGWVFGLPFGGNFPGGSYGYGQPGGVNIFFGFSHNRGVWVKTAAALGEECFFKVVIFQKPASKRWKRTPVFNFVAGNAIKIGVPETFFLKKKVIHDYLRFWFFICIFLTRNYTTARIWRVLTERLLNMKNTTKIGFRGCEEKSKQGLKQGKLMRSKMGCLEAFDNGVPMLRNISTPFLNALDDKLQVGISRDTLRRMKRFYRGKTRFFGLQAKNGSIFEPLKNKKHPEIEHNSPGWVNSWSPSCIPIKTVVSKDFWYPSFQRGAKCSSLSGVLVPKQALKKGDGSHPLFQFFVLVVVGGC